MASIRIYGKKLNTWKTQDEAGREIIRQYEFAYKEYDVETGDLVGEGSEDFSPERLKKQTEEHWIFTWDGERRNKGGHRWFDERGYVRHRSSEKKLVKEYMKNKYNAELVELRH